MNYLQNKVGVEDLTKAHGPKTGSCKIYSSHFILGFKTLPILGGLQNLLLPLYFRGNVSLPVILTKERKSLKILNQLVLLLPTAIPHKVYPIRNEFFHDLAMLSVLYND